MKLKSFKLWITAGVMVLTTAVLEYAGVLGWLRSGLEVGLQPFSQLGTRVVKLITLPLEFVRISTRKYSYVLDLELRYAESAAQLSQLERLQKENQALRKLIEGEGERAGASSSAQVADRKVAAILSYAQPTIAIGSADGIKEGSLVLVEGVLIGKVSQVSQHQSQIKLLPSFDQNEVILVQTDTGVTGLLAGNGAEVIVKELPIETQIQAGQRVETSGQVGVLPYLYVGRVQQFHRNEAAPTQTAVIDQGVSFYRSTVVEVLP